jgi:hypothetical protein
MQRPTFRLILALGLVATLAADVRAEIDSEKVRAGIERGTAFLKRNQNANGSWPDYLGNHQTGVTALCTLALLNCGIELDDAAIRKALNFLRNNPPPSPGDRVASSRAWTYSVSLQTMVFCAADPKADFARIGKLVDWLEKAQISSGENNGCWDYGLVPAFGGDNSNAQFALLALHEAERVGVKVKEQTWRRALGYWQRAQEPSGAWRYFNPKHKPSDELGSMTAAGIASIIIASGRLGEPDAKVVGDRVECCGQRPESKPDPVQKGLDWLAKRFSVHRNPRGANQFDARRGQTYHLYWLYGVERVGRMTGLRWIGRHDWYREGTELLVGSKTEAGKQTLAGNWIGEGHGENDENIATALALLFLSKGQRPVLVSKLQHGTGIDWNRHRHDLENLTRFVEGRWRKDIKTELSWQTVSSQHVTLEDLRQTPVLFISGRDGFDLSDEQKRVLRAYVDGGGFIFAEAACEGAGFDKAFRAFCDEMFPDGKLLPLDDPAHPIWNAEELLNPKFIANHPLYGINTGCRVGVVYTPKNLSCYWELGHFRREKSDYPPPVMTEIDFCLGLGINVLAYATNRQLKFKYEVPQNAEDAAPPDAQRGTIFIAKLRHSGGCDEAPTALANVLKTASAQLGLTVSTDRRLIAVTDKRLFDYHLVYLQGRRDFRFSDEERKILKTYLARGGMIMADAINSTPEFATAFRREIAAIFPGSKLEPIPPTHKLIDPSGENIYGVYDIRTVELREPIAGAAGERRAVKTSQIAPLLEGLKLDDRYQVIFSPYDLSCALENYESLQFPGYAREDAKKIMLNVLLYSLQR